MTPPPTPSGSLGYATRVAHDIGLATWLGGALFGKLAFNRSVRLIPDQHDRGRVTNAAYGAFNPINTAALGTAAAGWAAARLTETRPDKLTGTEKSLATAKDVLMGLAVATGAATGLSHAKLAKQAPGGAVALEDPTTPSSETPSPAAGLVKRIGVLTSANIAAGLGLAAVTAVMAQLEHSRPPARRMLRRSH
ncbi:MAG TPA: hypothetical protein VF533_12140 [Solirubrobacteraceae bacterium]|jgi:hypothetical protein